MDLFAGLFGLVLLTISVVLTYRWGIKPDREKKKRMAEEALAEMRRKHWEVSRRRRSGLGESINPRDSSRLRHQA